MTDEPIDRRTIYGFRVFERKTRKFVGVYGADVRGLVAMDNKVYGEHPHDTYAIERLTAHIVDYQGFSSSPAQNASAQEWAEFIWTPG